MHFYSSLLSLLFWLLCCKLLESVNFLSDLRWKPRFALEVLANTPTSLWCRQNAAHYQLPKASLCRGSEH
jgi:hypothetical protein